jgi:hypothetical protein
MRVPAIPHLMEAHMLRFNIPTQIPGLDWDIQRFWHPYEMSMDNTKDWLDSSYATMNWFGLRDLLATNGLDISFNYLSDLAGMSPEGKAGDSPTVTTSRSIWSSTASSCSATRGAH